MVLFGKKEKKRREKEGTFLPRLPELPKIPEFPTLKTEKAKRQISQLPSFPTNSLGEKFSRDTIKEAVTGEKENEEVFGADDFALEKRMRMMQEPLQKPLTKEIPIGKTKFPVAKRPRQFGVKLEREAEPVFIRIDKFEESLKIFEKVKRQVLEIEEMLKDITKVKEEEERELSFWEKEIQKIKDQIEKIDENIFSKVE